MKQTVPMAMLCSCHFVIKVNKSKVGPVYVTETYKTVEVQPHSFLTMVLDGVEWQASSPGRFTPKKEHRYALERKLGGPQSCCERFWGSVHLYLLSEWNSDPFSP